MLIQSTFVRVRCPTATTLIEMKQLCGSRMIYWHIAPFAAAIKNGSAVIPLLELSGLGRLSVFGTKRLRRQELVSIGPPTTQVGPSAPDLSVMHNRVRLQFSNCGNV